MRNLYALHPQQQVAVLCIDPSPQSQQPQGLEKDQGTQEEMCHTPRLHNTTWPCHCLFLSKSVSTLHTSSVGGSCKGYPCQRSERLKMMMMTMIIIQPSLSRFHFLVSCQMCKISNSPGKQISLFALYSVKFNPITFFMTGQLAPAIFTLILCQTPVLLTFSFFLPFNQPVLSPNLRPITQSCPLLTPPLQPNIFLRCYGQIWHLLGAVC